MKKFKKVYIEITNICNLQCSFCPPTKREGGFMTREKFEEVLGKIKDYTDYIYLHVKGEPTLHPQFEEILKSTKKYGLKINITTNGTLVEKYKELLLDKNIVRQVNISCHSHSAEEDLEGSIEYLDKVIDFAKEAGVRGVPYVTLRLWNLETNSIEQEKNRLILKKIEESFEVGKIDEEKIAGRGVNLAKNVFVNFGKRFEWPDEERGTGEDGGYCLGLTDHAAILVDGSVVPCCLDGEGKITLGNIFEKGFGEIIESPRANAIVEGFRKRVTVEELCKSCSFKNRF